MKLTLTLAFSLCLFTSFSQDSLSQRARSLKIHSGIPIQKHEAQNIWHHPDFELGFDVLSSFKLKNTLFFSFGAGLNFSQYRSEAYYQTYQTIGYSPLSGADINTYVDDYERQSLGRFMTIRVPVQVEYMPDGKWKPYARFGTVFDVQIMNSRTEVYAHKLHSAPFHYHATPKRVHHNVFLLSLTSSGGVKYQMRTTSLLFGVHSQVGLWNFDKVRNTGRIGIGLEFTVRKRLFPAEYLIGNKK